MEGVKGKDSTTWRNAIIEAWGKIQQTTLNKLVEALPRRMKTITEKNGQHVEYH
jgi:hypothetical protein